MHKPELAAIVAAKANLSKAKANEVITALTDEIADAVSRNETVSLIGFGSFSQVQRQARTGINPQNGETINIPASKNVTFKAGKSLKEAVNHSS